MAENETRIRISGSSEDDGYLQRVHAAVLREPPTEDPKPNFPNRQQRRASERMDAKVQQYLRTGFDPRIIKLYAP